MASARDQGRHYRLPTGQVQTFAIHPELSPFPPMRAAVARQHQRRVRRLGAVAFAGGVALFVIASLATNAGADVTLPAASGAAGDGWDTTPIGVHRSSLDPPVDETPSAAPVHVKKKARSDKKVISGLAANGIPNVALNAYRVAAARMGHALPSCGIDWALLAGIGRVESDHGRFAGAVLHPDGVSTPRIIGIPLNGSGTALITDTDGGQLDGDTIFDRAVGPMQFIPSTWASFGTDATGDAIADPFNINDAALTSARYLCAAGGDLRGRAGQVAAVLAYNNSDEYLAQVLALAEAYRSGTPISAVLWGNTTGDLPPVYSGGYLPPANPGAPTAVASSSTSTSGSTSTGSTSPTGTATTTVTPTSSPTASPTPTDSSTATVSPTPTDSSTATVSPTDSSTPTDSPSPTDSGSAT
jgi:membrane-bound lytic murein transglycosylase B